MNKINVTVKNLSGLNDGVVIRNIPTLSASRLEDLSDIRVENKVEGSTVVYEAYSGLYIIKPLEYTDISGDIDGGIF